MSESDHPMYESYGKYSDNGLVKALEWKRHFKRTVINRDIHRESAWYLDKEILCLETLLGQRIKQQAIEEASKEYSNEVKEDEMRTDELEIVVEEDLGNHGDGDDHPKLLPVPVPPTESLPLLQHDSGNNVIITPPPDIIAPIPFPPSPNISVQQHQPLFYLHPLPQLHIPNIAAPLPLPLKPNIPHMFLFRCSRTNIAWRGPDVCRDPVSVSLSLCFSLFLSIPPSVCLSGLSLYLFLFNTLSASLMDLVSFLLTL